MGLLHHFSLTFSGITIVLYLFSGVLNANKHSTGFHLQTKKLSLKKHYYNMKVTAKSYPEPTMEINLEDNIELIFKKYYKFVCSCIYKMIPDPNLTEDLAQDIFADLWKKRSHLKINTSLQAYLKKAAINRTLNHIRKKQVLSKADDTDVLLNMPDLKQNESLEFQELQEFINKTIDSLPKKCRIVFMLSRFDELSYKEIAKELEISIKTVENQISKALKVLRKALKKYEEKMQNEILPKQFRTIAC